MSPLFCRNGFLHLAMSNAPVSPNIFSLLPCSHYLLPCLSRPPNGTTFNHCTFLQTIIIIIPPLHISKLPYVLSLLTHPVAQYPATLKSPISLLLCELYPIAQPHLIIYISILHKFPTNTSMVHYNTTSRCSHKHHILSEPVNHCQVRSDPYNIKTLMTHAITSA